MPKPSPLTWVPLWERALDEEIGIAFVLSGVDREYFRNELYIAREKSNDPRLNDLVTFAPAAPHDNEIWICKKQVEVD